MSTIEEDPVSSPPPPSGRDFIEDDWSEVGDVDTDGGESGNESGMAQSIDSLGQDPDETMVVQRGLAQLSLRSRTWKHSIRSTSSPSRSPVRPTRQTVPVAPSNRQINRPIPFYEYLFS
jgi:hypothetical protein